MKVAVVGSRSITDEKLVIDFIKECHEWNNHYDKLISGGTSGVDSIAEKFAKDNKINTTILRPCWEKFGEQAPFVRNADIIAKADKCIIIWDGTSEYTENDIELCEQMKKPYYLYNVKTDTKISENEYL